MALKNLVTNKTGISIVNDDQKSFVSDPMKGQNVRSFSKK